MSINKLTAPHLFLSTSRQLSLLISTFPLDCLSWKLLRHPCYTPIFRLFTRRWANNGSPFQSVNRKKKVSRDLQQSDTAFRFKKDTSQHLRRRTSYISMAKPLTIVISGPSGSGKSTHIGHLKEAIPNTFVVATSHTTREPRAGEVHGREYHFVNKDAFQKLVQEGGFIEYAQFGSNYYGTSWQAVKDVAEQGRICILDIEMEVCCIAHPDTSPITQDLCSQPSC